MSTARTWAAARSKPAEQPPRARPPGPSVAGGEGQAGQPPKALGGASTWGARQGHTPSKAETQAGLGARQSSWEPVLSPPNFRVHAQVCHSSVQTQPMQGGEACQGFILDVKPAPKEKAALSLPSSLPAEVDPQGSMLGATPALPWGKEALA